MVLNPTSTCWHDLRLSPVLQAPIERSKSISTSHYKPKRRNRYRGALQPSTAQLELRVWLDRVSTKRRTTSPSLRAPAPHSVVVEEVEEYVVAHGHWRANADEVEPEQREEGTHIRTSGSGCSASRRWSRRAGFMK